MPFNKRKYQLKNSPGRRHYGQTLIEAMFGFVILIPIGLAAVDVVTLMSTTQTNEQWAETAARAAGSCTCENLATTMAKKSLARFVPTNIISSIEMEKIKFDELNGQVTVSTVMQVNMPIPMPLMNRFECRASAIQPLVATPAQQ